MPPIQKPEKLPETIPERIVKEEPPSFEAVTTSFVCFAFGEVNNFVASGIKAAPNVPQEIITDKINHKLFSSPPSNALLTPNVIIIENIDVNQTRFDNGASKSNFSVLDAYNLVIPLLTQYAITDVNIIRNLIVNIQVNN